MSYRYKPKEIRIKLTKMRLILPSLTIILISILIALYPYIYSWYVSLRPVKEINYYGVPMEFREDLRLAKKIPVFPSEEYITGIFGKKDVERITLAILNSTNETSLIGVEAYEITFKLSAFYTLMNSYVEIKGKEVFSISEIKGNERNLVIYVIPPVIASETSVRVENYTVYISGKNLKELDLATIKFLMVILGIEV